MSVLDGKKSHKCAYCIKSFTTAFSLRRHLNKFHPKRMAENEKSVRVVKCELCCNEFKNLDTLKDHFDSDHQGKNIDFRISWGTASSSFKNLCDTEIKASSGHS